MFGYVRPPQERLSQASQERFRHIYCGLCHTLGRRYGAISRFILNYDFTCLAILLSAGEKEPPLCEARCPASPFKKQCHCSGSAALELAADESVILTYWQLMDGVADHGVLKGSFYRLAAALLRPAYRKAAAFRPSFDKIVQERLAELSSLEHSRCDSLDAPADAFAGILAAAAEEVGDPVCRRVLYQLLYHLGRWVYLVDAADDLKEDAASGNYNPIALRYGLADGTMPPQVRKQFAVTLDHSIHMIATAYELWDFGCWSEILCGTIYEGLFSVGKAVLDGKFHEKRNKIRKRDC